MVTAFQQSEILNLETIAEVTTLRSNFLRTLEDDLLQGQREDVRSLILLVFDTDAVFTIVTIDTILAS
jgi:hypothetical protein